MANEVMFVHSQASADMWTSLETSYSQNGLVYIGNNYDEGSSSDRSYTSALRFQGITVTGTIDYAGLYFWTQYDGRDETPRDGEWKFIIYGIDEDNTSSFSSSPLGRTKTTAYENSDNASEPNTDTWKQINVTDPVNEILTRPGFSSGNALGLIFEDNGSGKNKYAGDIDDRLAFLLIRKSAEPDFTPTNSSIAAPSFPAADNYGIKISYPGYNVLTATDQQLYFTTRKKLPKILTQGKITTVASTVYNIAHGQSYKPFAIAYFKSVSSTKRYKIPRFIPGEMQDPDAETTDGYLEVDATNVKIMTTDACEVYYYIFIDELAT